MKGFIRALPAKFSPQPRRGWNETRLRVLVVLWLLAPWSVSATGTNQAAGPWIFHVGLSQICFRDVNRNDAVASYKAFLEGRGRLLGKFYEAEPQVFEDTPSFEAAIQHQPMHMAVMDAWQFLTMDIHREMKPFFTVKVNGTVGRKYLVLTRRGSGLNTLQSLQGKALLEIDIASSNVGKTWLDTLLLSDGLAPQETFFGGVEVVAKPAAAVLPVFFGKTPACVVDGPSFEIMKELNPQVGERLQVVAVSDIFADGIICLSENYWLSKKDKADTIQSLADVHLDPVGQQMCVLFKIDRMVPFQDSQLDTIRNLRSKYESLRRGVAAAGGPAQLLALPGKTILPKPQPSQPDHQN